MGFLILYSMIAYYVVDFMQHSSVFNYIFLTLLMVVLFVYVSYRFLVGNRERELINDGVKIAIGR